MSKVVKVGYADYMDKDEYYGGVAPLEWKGRDERVIIRIKPERVLAFVPGN